MGGVFGPGLFEGLLIVMPHPGGEDCESCPQDCGPCDGVGCGDGQWDDSVDCGTCPADCGPCEVGCGDGQCDAGLEPQEHMVIVTDNGFEPNVLEIHAGDTVWWMNEMMPMPGMDLAIVVSEIDGKWATEPISFGESFPMTYLEPGEYAFICTYPGHWRMMNGVMLVRSPRQ